MSWFGLHPPLKWISPAQLSAGMQDFADLANIGTLFAFVPVSIGVLILRYRERHRYRGFRVPVGPVFPVLSIVFCIILRMGLEVIPWVRFFARLFIGLFVYFFYSRHRSEFAANP